MEIFGGFELTSISVKLVIAVAVLFLIYDWWCHQFFQRQGIRVLPYRPIVGSTPYLELGYKFTDLQKKYGKVFGLYFFRTPVFAITDADLLKQIMVKNFSHFVNRREDGIPRKPMDKGLLSLKNDQWKNVRTVVTPAFSLVKMKQMSPMINVCCDTLVENFRKAEKEGKPADCKKLYGGFTMDSVAWCGFGLKVDSQKNKDDEFVVMAQMAFNARNQGLFLLINLFPPLKPIFKRFDVSPIPAQAIGFFSKVTEEARKLRKDHQNSKEQIDMLQLLLNAHNETADELDNDGMGPQIKTIGQKQALTVDEVTAQAITFFLAGYETTNTLLGFASYLLATNQDCQEKLYSEIMDMAPTRDLVGYDTVSKMTYLDMVISESLRLYPPAAGIFRICNKTLTCDGITIEKGNQVFISIYTIHRDERYWSDPEKFDPERFSPEKKASLQPCTYLPFGFGPRSCIGMRFALLEAKMALVRVLQQYRLDVCPETEVPLGIAKGIFTSPKDGIKLRPVPRK